MFSSNQPKKVTIVGGNGRMGNFFAQQLSAATHDVQILERDNWSEAEQLLGNADLVLISVPIECTVEVIERVAKYLNPNTALADLTSVKTSSLQAMLEHHSGPVLGLHPMFGPMVSSFSTQRVVVCSGRQEPAFDWLLTLIEREGGQLMRCSPEEHDQMMVAIQAIRNFDTFSLGVFLTETNIDLERSLDFATPPYRLELELVNRLFSQSAPMVVDIMLNTLERRDAITRLAATYSRLAELIQQQDRDALIQELQLASSLFNQQIGAWSSPRVTAGNSQRSKPTSARSQKSEVRSQK
jgi:prephenate dehydrogenase/chorismate mutase/prephenate dehydrogenase